MAGKVKKRSWSSRGKIGVQDTGSEELKELAGQQEQEKKAVAKSPTGRKKLPTEVSSLSEGEDEEKKQTAMLVGVGTAEAPE